MTEAKHKSGIWVVNAESDDCGAGKLSVETSDGYFIAQVDEGLHQGANARLIAAAPELLEALILMVRTHDEPAESLLQEMKEQQWLKLAREAIAKATGEQA